MITAAKVAHRDHVYCCILYIIIYDCFYKGVKQNTAKAKVTGKFFVDYGSAYTFLVLII